MEEKIKTVGIDIEYLGENQLFLHKQWGEGTLGKKNKRKIRLIQVDPATLILQVHNKVNIQCYAMSADSITNAFIKAVEEFENEKRKT